jgi:lactate dehydrogenase-like 2-hydroxyacid dehydrogenase
MKHTKIIGILIKDRIKEAGRTQAVLTKYNDIIQSRLGFHELSDEVCSRVGIIVLTLTGKTETWELFEEELSAIGGLEIKDFEFEY